MARNHQSCIYWPILYEQLYNPIHKRNRNAPRSKLLLQACHRVQQTKARRISRLESCAQSDENQNANAL